MMRGSHSSPIRLGREEGIFKWIRRLIFHELQKIGNIQKFKAAKRFS
jgi:hypothetical protein